MIEARPGMGCYRPFVVLGPASVAYALALVAVFSAAARWFTASPWKAVGAGWLTSAGLFLLATPARADRRWIGLASLLAAAMVLLAIWHLGLRLRRTGPPGVARSLFTRHWSGQVSLSTAAYNAGVLVSVLSVLVGFLTHAPIHRFTRTVAGAIVAGWLAALALAAWLLVGVWRAAAAHADRGGFRPWGWLARTGAIVGWLVFLLAAIVDAAPQVNARLRTALGPPERSRYRLRLLRNGTELELSGVLAWGVSEEVAATLREHRGVRVLHLDSPGGRLAEARQVATIVGERGLATYVASRCESACVAAFLGASERLLSRHAVIGFHAPSDPTGTALSLRRSADALAEWYVARGVDRAFVQRGLSTPSAEMWTPSHAELLSARVATRHARWDEVALSGATPGDLERLPLRLREKRFFQALFEFERASFERVVQAMRDGYARGSTAREAIGGVIEPTVSRIARQDLKRASDGVVARFWRFTLEVGRELRRRDPKQCASWLASGVAQAGGQRFGEDGVLDVLGDALSDARLSPATVPDLPAVKDVLLGVYRRAGTRVPDLEILENDDQARARPLEYCDAGLAVAEEIAQLAPDVAGPLLRYLLSRESAPETGRAP